MNPLYGNTGTTSIYTIHAHRLSVFFAVMASGGMQNEDCVTPTPLVLHYHTLSRAAFSIESIMQGVDVVSIQALLLIMSLMTILDPHLKNNDERWLLHGTCVRLAKTVRLCLTDPLELSRANIFCRLGSVCICVFHASNVLLTGLWP